MSQDIVRVTASEQHILRSAFPTALAQDVDAVLRLVPVPPIRKTQSGETVSLASGEITLPYRIYYDPLERYHTDILTPVQRRIFDCLYSRHGTGQVREASLRRIIRAAEPWVRPYILGLLGDYVIEISGIVAADREVFQSDASVTCANENPDFISLLSARATSFWDCHYRDKLPSRSQYTPLVALSQLRQRMNEQTRGSQAGSRS